MGNRMGQASFVKCTKQHTVYKPADTGKASIAYYNLIQRSSTTEIRLGTVGRQFCFGLRTPNVNQQKVDRRVGHFPYLVYSMSSSVMVLPYLCRGWYERLQARVEEGYLTVVPAISNSLDDPSHGSNDTEDARDPMTTIEDPYCLNDARGSGAKWISLATRLGFRELP